MVPHDGGDFVILNPACQAVAAEKDRVAFAHLSLEQIHVN